MIDISRDVAQCANVICSPNQKETWSEKRNRSFSAKIGDRNRMETQRVKSWKWNEIKREWLGLYSDVFIFLSHKSDHFFTLLPRKLPSFTTLFSFSFVDAMQIYQARDRSLFAPLENLLSCSPELGISSYCWEQSSRAKKAGGWEKRWGNVATCFSASFSFFISRPLNKGEGRPH